MKVLLVDDNTLLLASDALRIEDLGHQVVTAMSGSAALELLKEEDASFDAIITDMQMPEGDGLSLIEYLNANALTIPTLLHSADDFYCKEGEIIPLEKALKPFPFAHYASKAAARHIEHFLAPYTLPISVAAQ